MAIKVPYGEGGGEVDTTNVVREEPSTTAVVQPPPLPTTPVEVQEEVEFNPYLETARETFGDAPAPAAGPENPYLEAALETFGDPVHAVKRSVGFAVEKKPETQARVMQLSQETGLPPQIIEKNLEMVEKGVRKKRLDYDRIATETPALGTFLSDPNNAALAQDDLDGLRTIEQGVRLYADAKAKRPGYGSDLLNAGKIGSNNLIAGTMTVATLFGIAPDQKAGLQMIADSRKRAKELQAEFGPEQKAFNEQVGREAQELDTVSREERARFARESSRRLLGRAVEEFKKGRLLEALKGWYAGRLRTTGEAIDLFRLAGSQPSRALVTSTESLAYSAPSIVGTVAGIPGGPPAMIAGSFLGSVGTEVGAELLDLMDKAGYDTTTVEGLERAFSNAEKMAEWKKMALAKGATVAGVGAALDGLSGKLFTAIKGAGGAVRTVGAALGSTATGMVTESAGEALGQLAEHGGDTSKVSPSEVIQEGLFSPGQSAATTAIGATASKGFRTLLPADTTQAAEELVERVDQARKAEHDIQALKEAGEAVQGLKNVQKVPGKVQEIVDTAGEGGKVYFQTDEWDKLWQGQGLSPAQATEQITGSPTAYHEAKGNEGPIEIPLGAFLEKVGTDKALFEKLLPIARREVDGPTLEEAKKTIEELPQTLDALAKEAVEAEKAAPPTQDDIVRDIEKQTETQLRQRYPGYVAKPVATLQAERQRTRADIMEDDLAEVAKGLPQIVATDKVPEQAMGQASPKDVTHNVTWEAVPGSGIGAEITSASPAAREVFTAEAARVIEGEGGRDELAFQLGITSQKEPGTGGYAGEINANVISGIQTEDPAKAEAYARAIQYIFRQDAVPYFQAQFQENLEESGLSRGVLFTFKGELTTDTERAFFDALRAALHPDAGYTRVSAREIVVINYRDEAGVPPIEDGAFAGALEKLAKDHGKTLGLQEVADFGAEAKYGPVHDWGADSDGQRFLDEASAGGSPALQSWLRDRRQAFDELLEVWSGDALRQREAELAQSGILFQSDDSDPGGGGRGGENREEADRGAVREEAPLGGLPASSPGPNPTVREAARKYLERAGLPFRQQAHYVKADPERGARIAQAYEQMAHDPENPEVKAAYRALIDETLAQYQAIKEMGLVVEMIPPGAENPYPEGPRQVHEDIRNGHLWVFPTESGFGTINQTHAHPLLELTNEYIGDYQLKANDVFRIVHDVFGHAKEGFGFGPHGEENAWQAHVRMYSPLAAKAMTTETRGQNSWINFGPYGEGNRANQKETVYADQKTGLLPDWVMAEGLALDDVPALFNEKRPVRPDEDFASVQSIRYGTPEGNIWVSRATDKDGKVFTGTGKDREESRTSAKSGGIQIQEVDPTRLMQERRRSMLVLGSNSFQRQKLPFFILQNYDVHYFFHPNSNAYWHIGAMTISRTNPGDIKYVAVRGGDVNQTLDALNQAVLVQRSTPEGTVSQGEAIPETQAKWLANWVYRQPKLSLRDVLALEAYPQEEALKALSEPPPQFQKEDKVYRGFFDRMARIIGLLPKANESTIIHELAHSWFQELGEDTARLRSKDPAKLTEKQKKLLSDVDTILEWLGAPSMEAVTDEQQETFARAWEAYLAEGNAPSAKLKQVFHAFKVWMLRLGRILLNLDVKMKPEIREVFARMVATEEHIGTAESKYATPTAEALGLTGEKAERYKTAMAEAEAAGSERFLSRLMKAAKRKQTAEYKATRARVRAEIEAQVNQRLEYRAMHFLKTGKNLDGSEVKVQPFKISRQSIVTQTDFGPHRLKTLPRGIVSKDGLHHDMAAELLGFRSGEEMLAAFELAPPRAKLIDELTDARMEEEYPDLLKDPKLPEEAVRAIHTEKRAQFLRLQLEFIAANHLPVLKDAIRQVARRLPPDRQVREQVTRTIARQPVQDLRPHIYEWAERKAAREAGAALARGDFEAAFDWKRKELLNHELYRATIEAQERIEKARELFKKFSQKDEKLAKSRDMDLINAGRAVLARYSVGKVDKAAEDYLKPIAAYDPDTYQMVKAMVDSATATAGPVNEITFDDFVALHDTMQALWDLSKFAHELEIDGQKMSFTNARDRLLAKIQARTGPEAAKLLKETVPDNEDLKRGLLGFAAANARVQYWARLMDDGKAGDFTTFIVRPVFDGATAFRAAKEVYLKKVLAIVQGIQEGITTKPIRSDELDYTFREGKAELLGAMLHIGNSSNKAKLLIPMGWGVLDKDGNLDSAKWDDFIARMMKEGVITKSDMDAIQALWDLFEETKPQAQRVHKKLYGHYFGEVSAEPVVTPWGTYRGGYVPARPDPLRSFDGQLREDQAALEDGGFSNQYPTVPRGFTKKRVENYAVPLVMDIRLVPMSLDAHLRFIHLQPAIKQVSRLVLDKKLRAALTAMDPVVAQSMLVPWLQRSASQKVVQTSRTAEGRLGARLARGLRSRAGLSVMFANVVNSAQNITGFSVAKTRVKKPFVRAGIWRYLTDRKNMTEGIAELSPFMNERMNSQVMRMYGELEDILINPSLYQKGQEWVKRNGYFLQSAVQNVVDTIVWSGAYEQAVANGLEGKAAVREADDAVDQTQGSNNPERIQTFGTESHLARMFTLFTGYFNMQANLLGTDVLVAKRTSPTKKAFVLKTLSTYMLVIAVPAVMTELLLRAASGKGLDADDDDEYMDDILSILFLSQIRGVLGLVPIAGPVAQMVMNRFDDNMMNDRLSTPITSIIENAARSLVSVPKALLDEDASKSRAIKDALSLLTLFTGYPFTALGKPLGYAADVSQGKADPTGPIDFTRGLVTGKPGASP